MAKSQVILTHNVEGLGGESDQVQVAPGYARNYLYPQGLAIPVTRANKRRIEVLRQRRIARETSELSNASELKGGLEKMVLLLKVRTGEDGKMFGSVTPAVISDELKHQFDIDMDRRRIHLKDQIRAVGEYKAELRLHTDVSADLTVRIESLTGAAEPAKEAVVAQ
jgi:large subunit ribosomal protein L9